MAEVLITLGIIGVVAALTLPTLIQNYKEQETVTRLKNAYSTVSNAYLRILEEDGEPSNWGMDEDNFAIIITEKFSKYIKNVKICDPSKQNSKCFIAGERLDLFGHKSLDIQGVASLIMANGVVIGFDVPTVGTFECRNNYCFHIHVDVNGNRGPNRWGYDTFIFQVKPDRIAVRGEKDTHRAQMCDPVNDVSNYSWPNGSACGAYVLQESNMDYLKCIRGNTSYCSKKYYFANF